MARVLIVGCGCRGRELAGSLGAAGYAVRGTSRGAEGSAAIDAAGFEGVVADPDRLGTMMPALEGASAVCWLMGSARGSLDELAALHGPRLRSMLETLVDTPVRGFVYEAAGAAPAAVLEDGAASVRDAAERWRMPVRVVAADPADVAEWARAITDAVDAVLA